MNAHTISVTVVGGYLGAGKTTLVNHVLRSSDERIAVIVNDFGEISIDEDLIVAADSDKLTLANGCICCTLADGFAAALMQIRSAGTLPQRLLIEASGVADPTQIAAYGHTPGLRLDAVVVMADAEQVRRQANDRWVADTVRMQLAAADLLVVNKIDLLDDASKADDLCDWLAGLSPGATVVRASRAAVPIDVLLGPRSASDAVGAGERPAPEGAAAPGWHVVEDLFESQTVVLDTPVPMPVIEALLADLPDGVARLKGLVQAAPAASTSDTSATETADATAYLVEAVGKRTSITPHATDPTQPPPHWAISLIAHKGTLPPDWLRSQLQSGC
ncbi:CobW family GTP-binding protein [Candidatus Poriferisodalis sp.]|uniref:CobW family GTP-binding protein n=1 Tax=Candidatus Poriferisodalis sp. TaxID=3101277 RepID=UPI003B02B527